jgi:CRP-like cAMP-binding protein
LNDHRLVDARQIVRLVYLFEDLDPAEQRATAVLLQPFEAAAGETLFVAGAPAERIYLIASGDVDVSPFGRVGASGVLGEAALNGRTTHAATARALSDVRGFTLEATKFETLRAAAHPIAAKVLRQLALALAARLREEAA